MRRLQTKKQTSEAAEAETDELSNCIERILNAHGAGVVLQGYQERLTALG